LIHLRLKSDHKIYSNFIIKMQKNELEVFYPKNQTEWRTWLQENHLSKQAVWLVYHSKKSKKDTITWSDAVDQALCFGWIDSKRVSIDNETSHQYFCKRKPKSNWSKINKIKIEKLIEQGLMKEAGLQSIEIAKQNGSWTILDDVEELVVPPDMELELTKKPIAKEFYLGTSKSLKKMILYWLVSAKTTETRQKRLTEIIECAEQNMKPKHMQ
jgi:uncharacterized protein YdeI (YjbR/CyaY-like superfamily)